MKQTALVRCINDSFSLLGRIYMKKNDLCDRASGVQALTTRKLNLHKLHICGCETPLLISW